MALLAAYAIHRTPGETLPEYLDRHVFASAQKQTCSPRPEDTEGFERYCQRFTASLDAERAACRCLK